MAIMCLSFLKNPQPAQLFPLNEDISQACVAGTQVRSLQEQMWGDAKGIVVRENAWVSASDIQRLISADSGILNDSTGQLLARKGPPMAALIEASPESFLIKYSWDLLHLNESILASLTESAHQGTVHPAANVDGILITGPGTRILPGVYIEGTVVIGANCKIGPNCYLRGATSIGDDCHIGQSVEIKNSILGNGTSVGHLSYVGDSILGHHVNLGAGTTTSNLRHDNMNHKTQINGILIDTGRRKFGTVIGDNVHTGIHTAIYPGRKLAADTTTLPNQTVDKDIT